MIVCNIVLIKQNLQLRQIVEQEERDKKVQVGDQFNEFKAFDKDNNSIDLAGDKSVKKVLLFSSTSCPFCRKQNSFWIQLTNQLKAENYKILMLFNNREEYSKVEEYLKTYGYANIDNSIIPVFSDNETLQKYKLNGTPTTLVISENGTVEKSWSGLWDKTTISEVETYFQTEIN